MPLSLSQILDGLNESQKNAVVTTEDPVLIVAGAGTGKINHYPQDSVVSCRILS
jgi:hypothetical protein